MHLNWINYVRGLIILLFIYWLIPPKKGEWFSYYLLPVLFFLYFLVKSLTQVKAFFAIKEVSIPVLTLRLISHLLVIVFLAIAIASYIIRQKPVQKAKGIKERAFPLFVLICQYFGFHLLQLLQTYNYSPRFRGTKLFHLIVKYVVFRYNPTINISGVVVTIIGVIIGCLALWRLKRSFSIMVEVRTLITTGIYSRIRHPLYAGEILSLLGIAMAYNSLAAYIFFLFLFTMQTIRAKLEEKKLLASIPEYAGYKANTGFYLPRFRKG